MPSSVPDRERQVRLVRSLFLQELGERVWERTARAVESTTGYRVSSVDVTVADLHVPGEPMPTKQPGQEGTSGAGGARVDF